MSQEKCSHSVLRMVYALPDEATRSALLPLVPAAATLDKLYMPTRYPNGLPDLTPSEVFTRADGESAIAAASSLLEFAAARIGEGGCV